MFFPRIVADRGLLPSWNQFVTDTFIVTCYLSYCDSQNPHIFTRFELLDQFSAHIYILSSNLMSLYDQCLIPATRLTHVYQE